MSTTITEFVTEAYVKTGNGQTAQEIAEGMGWTVAKVRKAINDDHGCPRGLVCDQEVRPSFSKDYKMIQTGTHKVWIYFPTRSTLRDRIIALETALRSKEV